MITLLLSIAMFVLAIRFNNDGLTTDFGEMTDYSNFAFIALLSFAFLAAFFSIYGIILCKAKKRGCAVCFGLFLLPVAISTIVFGAILTGVSHTEGEDL